MAESISEGTLKQWSKKIGDYVEQDEEIATIETDKVRRFFLARATAFTDTLCHRLMFRSMLPKLAL